MGRCTDEEAACVQLTWLRAGSRPSQYCRLARTQQVPHLPQHNGMHASAVLTRIRRLRIHLRLPPAHRVLQREPGLRNKLQLCGRRQPVDGGGFTVAAGVQLTAQNGCTSGLPAATCLRCSPVPVLLLEAKRGESLSADEPPRPHPALCAVQEEAQWVPGTDHFVSGQGHYTQVSDPALVHAHASPPKCAGTRAARSLAGLSLPPPAACPSSCHASCHPCLPPACRTADCVEGHHLCGLRPCS